MNKSDVERQIGLTFKESNRQSIEASSSIDTPMTIEAPFRGAIYYKIMAWRRIGDLLDGAITLESVREASSQHTSHLVPHTVKLVGLRSVSLEDINEAFSAEKIIELKMTDRDTFVLLFNGDQILFEGYAVDVKIASSPARPL